MSEDFGEPPCTLFHAPQFHIDALFWLGPTTSIHEHGFSGAFTLLEGESLQAVYDFDEQRRLSGLVGLGELELRSLTMVRRGEVQPIAAGSSFIHSVFHLGAPTVTLVVRTTDDPRVARQRDFLPPGIAYDLRSLGYERRRQHQLVMMQLRASPEAGAVTAESLWGRSNFTQRLGLALALVEGGHDEVLDDLLGDGADLALHDASASYRRHRYIEGRAQRVSHADHRLLLALLSTLEDRSAVIDWLRVQRPERPPLQLVERWLRQMSAEGTLGIRLDDGNLELCIRMLHGAQPEQILAERAREYGSEWSPEKSAMVRRNCQILRESPVWGALVR
ncbi:MAG: hypothetical protein AB1Z98_16195 [Nannocystaceae bacterium]